MDNLINHLESYNRLELFVHRLHVNAELVIGQCDEQEFANDKSEIHLQLFSTFVDPKLDHTLGDSVFQGSVAGYRSLP